MAATQRDRGDELANRRRFRAAVRAYKAALKWTPDDQELRTRRDTARATLRKRRLVAFTSAVAVIGTVAAVWILLVTNLRIQIDPALRDYSDDLRLLLDGKQITVWGNHRILIGKHRLQALSPRYRDVTQDLQAKPLTPLDVVLRAEPRAGDLRIESKPAGAVVWVNGEARGQTPLNIKGIPVPSASVRVEKRHFKATEERVQIADGSSTTLSYNLERTVEQPVQPIGRQVLSRLFPPKQDGPGHIQEIPVERVEYGSFTEPGATEALVEINDSWPELWLVSFDEGAWKRVRKIAGQRGLEFRVVDLQNDEQDEVWVETSECHQGECWLGYQLLAPSVQTDRTLFKMEGHDNSGEMEATGEAVERALAEFLDLDGDGRKELLLLIVTETYSNGAKTGERMETKIYTAGAGALALASTDRFPCTQLAQAPNAEQLHSSVEEALPGILSSIDPHLHSCKDHKLKSAIPVLAVRSAAGWQMTLRVQASCQKPVDPKDPFSRFRTPFERLVGVSVQPRANGAFTINLLASHGPEATGSPGSTKPAKIERSAEVTDEPQVMAKAASTVSGSPTDSSPTHASESSPPPLVGFGARERIPMDLGTPFRDAFSDGAKRLHSLVAQIGRTLTTVTEAGLLAEIAGTESLPRPQSRRSASARKLNDEGIKAVGGPDPERAIAIFESAYRSNPTDVEITENLGYAYLSGGKLDQAEFYLTLSTLMVPRRSTSWNNLGQIYALRGDIPSATACFVTAYAVSRSRDGTRRFYDKLRVENPHQEIRTAAEKTLELVGRSAFASGEPPVMSR